MNKNGKHTSVIVDERGKPLERQDEISSRNLVKDDDVLSLTPKGEAEARANERKGPRLPADGMLIACTNGKDLIGWPQPREDGLIELRPVFAFVCGMVKLEGPGKTICVARQCELWPLYGLLSVQGLTLPPGSLIVGMVGDQSEPERRMWAAELENVQRRLPQLALAERTGIDVGAGMARGNQPPG